MTQYENYDEKMEIAKNINSCVKYFDVLGDTTRLQILVFLLQEPNREMTVDSITQSVFMSRPAVSHHLKILKDCNILVCRTKAQYHYYSINRKTEIWRELYELFAKIDNLLNKFKGAENE